MGQKKSKSSGRGRDSRRSPSRCKGSKDFEKPQDSPLGLMIRYWDDWPSRKGKSKEKMVHYCVEVWGGNQIRSDPLYWPMFRYFEDWISQILNTYKGIWVTFAAAGGILIPMVMNVCLTFKCLGILCGKKCMCLRQSIVVE